MDAKIFCIRKLGVPGLLQGIVSVILRLSVIGIIPAGDRQMDELTDT